TAIGMGLGLAAAIALRTTGRWSAIVLAGMVFVWALPPVVNGSVWKFLFAEDGLINVLVLLTPLRSEPIPFLYDATWALISVSLVTTWAVIPFNALVFRAALLGISPEIFEAAALDGAGKFSDSDVYKLMEAMAWEIGRTGDEDMERRFRELTAVI